MIDNLDEVKPNVFMAKPNFSQLSVINDLLNNIYKLEGQIKKAEDNLLSFKTDLKNKEESLEKHFLEEGKQRLLLDAIQEELIELRSRESALREDLEKTVDEAIQNYFEKGDFAKFVKDLLSKIKKTDKDIKVIASKDTQKFLPTEQKTEKGQDGQLIIEIGSYKEYILDPKVVKENLRDRLIKRHLPATFGQMQPDF